MPKSYFVTQPTAVYGYDDEGLLWPGKDPAIIQSATEIMERIYLCASTTTTTAIHAAVCRVRFFFLYPIRVLFSGPADRTLLHSYC